MQSKKSFLQLLKETFLTIRERNFKRHAAALAHYMSFSIIPALIVIATIGTLTLDADDITEDIVQPIRQVTNRETAQVVEDAILATRDGISANPIGAAIGALTLLYGASRMFRHLKYSIDDLWNVPQAEHTHVLAFLRDSAAAMLFVIAVGVVLLLVLVSDTAMYALLQRLDDILPNTRLIGLFRFAGIGLLLVVLTLIFAVLYKTMPDAKVSWRDVWIGAAMTSFLFILGQIGIGLYLEIADVDTIYGAAATIMIVIIWVYVTAHLILLGAKFTYLYANRFGNDVTPDPDEEDVADASA